MKSTAIIRVGLTVIVVLAAALLAWLLWKHYMYSPWTRDARVRAAVIQVAPDVSGPIKRVAVHDNQTVAAGDLLFEIDPVRFEYALQQAKAQLAQASANVKAAQAGIASAKAQVNAAYVTWKIHQEQAQRLRKLGDAASVEQRNDAIAKAKEAKAHWHAAQAQSRQAESDLASKKGELGQAQAKLAQAKLNLKRSQVRAPTDGRVTNLHVYSGDYAHTGQANLAIVADHDYWLYGYFEETKVPAIALGDSVDIRLMNGVRFKGSVQGIAGGIADDQNDKKELLSDVDPIFSWVRLAQRIPVRIEIDMDSVPKGTHLVSGMTATVTLHPSGE